MCSVAVLVGVALSGCDRATDITAAPDQVGIALAPNFQVLPSFLGLPQVDRIRLRAIDPSTSEVLANTDVSVDPRAAQWTLDLAVDLRRAPWVRLFVETELLSGDKVEWSGRTVPFTVTQRGSGPQAVDVFRGPLDNLDAVGLEIDEGALRVLHGSNVELSAAVTLKEGSNASPVVFWGANNPLVAALTTDAGRTTLTGLIPGNATIFATAGAVTDTLVVEVRPVVSGLVISSTSALLAGLGFTTQLSAAVLDGFGDPAPDPVVSWSTSGDSVLSVDTEGLVTSLGFGRGTVSATSGGVSASFDLPVLGPDLVLNAVSVLPDLLSSIGQLSDTRFQIGIANVGLVPASGTTVAVRVLDGSGGEEAHPVLVFPLPELAAGETFDLDALAGGQVLSLSLPSSLRFEVVLDPMDEIRETEEGNNALATDLFDVLLDPLELPELVELVEWLGVTTIWEDALNWSTGVVPGLTDNVLIPLTEVAPTITSAVSIADLSFESGAAVNLDGGTLSVSGGLGAGLSVVGTGSVLLSGTAIELEGEISTDLEVTGTALVAGPLTVRANVAVTGEGAILDLNGQRVDIDGSLTLADGGSLRMDSSLDYLSVGGDVVFSVDSSPSSLTGGVLAIGGDLEVTGTGLLSASPGHTVALLGVDQAVRASGAAPPVFHDLVIEAGAGVTLEDDIAVHGNLDVRGGTLDIPTGVVAQVRGALLAWSGSAVFVDGTVAGGSCTASDALIGGRGEHSCTDQGWTRAWLGGAPSGPRAWANDQNWRPVGAPSDTDDVRILPGPNQAVLGAPNGVRHLLMDPTSALDLGTHRLTITGSAAVQGVVSNGEVLILGGGDLFGTFDVVRIGGDASLTGPLMATNLAIGAGLFEVGGLPLAVAGTMTVEGSGRLSMANASGSVDVGGGVTFDGASHEGLLRAGTLSIGGDLTVTGSSPSGFVGSGTHLVRFAGATLQHVTFAWPGISTQRFAHVTFDQTVQANSDLVATGSFEIGGSGALDAVGYTLSVGGALIAHADALNTAAVRLIGSVSALPAAFASDLFIDASVTLASDLAVSGNVIIDGGDLTVGSNSLSVAGNLMTTAAGRLVMTAAAATVDVDGSVSFGGGDQGGSLTSGTLMVGGDFLVTGSSPTAFASTDSHSTVLDGSGDQLLALALPGTTQQRFWNLTISKTTGSVQFASTFVVTGTFSAEGAALVQAVAGAVVDVRGLVALDDVTMTRLPLRIMSGAAPSAQSMNRVSFESMDPADVQLDLTLPGLPAAPASFTNMRFDSPAFTTGAHVRTERLSGLSDVVIVLTGTTPLVLLSRVILGLHTLVTWL